MAQRILILSAAVGAGHLRAAQAMELAFKATAPDAEVSNIDVLTLTNALFRRLYGTAYLDLANKAPHFLGAFYDWSDKLQKTRGKSHKLREVVQKMNLNRVMKLLEEPWDMVVNTHFLPADIIARRRRQGKLALRHVTLVTDFDAHAFWVNEPCDRYYVAAEEAGLSLTHWGVARANITVTGIPVHPVFAIPKDRAECRRKHALSSDRPVVLMLAGGFGVGPIEEMYRALLAMDLPVHIAAVCGKNAELKKRLDKSSPPPTSAPPSSASPPTSTNSWPRPTSSSPSPTASPPARCSPAALPWPS
jgi:processive 1,2-diacylglycerol beta-glucosyltransferase